MATTEPEKTSIAVREASATLESKAVVDRQFPDLYKTFTNPSQYTESSSEACKSVILKNNITMPAYGLVEMNKFDHKSPCGIAPLIKRAYFVIKNCLYLFDYEESGNIKTYEDGNDIVGVGFVKPKPGLFVDRVKQVMVLATTKEIKVIGVVNGLNELDFIETYMSTSSNGVHMHQIIGTNQGRIFMLGDDDNVWELDYRAQETWFASKCSKKLQTSGGSFDFLFGKLRDKVIQIAVNESGTVLYQLTKNSCIHVIYLGTDGYTFKTVYKKTDCIADAKRSNPHSAHFTPNAHIVSIHTTTASESLYYHLVAITSNGCRIYYNNQKEAQHVNYDAEPTGLITVHVRTPSNALATTDLVSKPLYKNAFTMLVKNANASETQSQIVTFSPDLANLGNCILPNSNIQLKENCSLIDIHGKILDIVELPIESNGINEFKYSYNATPRHFLVLTTSGVTILVKQRPVDMLHNLLIQTGSDTLHRILEFEPFFNHFGYLNASSLCFNLIASSNVSSSNSLYDTKPIDVQEVKGAEILLKRFGQVTSALSDVHNHSYSSLHDGLALYMYRVIHGMWTKKLIKETSTAAGKSYSSNISLAELHNTQKILTWLKALIDRSTSLFPFTPVSTETKSLGNLVELIFFLNEAISFFTYIFQDDLNSIIKLVKPTSQAQLFQYDVKTLLTTSEGMSTVSDDLTSALIEYTFKRYNSFDHVIDVLTTQCGSFCSVYDVLLYKAASQIYSARNANKSQAKAILHDSLATLKKIAVRIPAKKAAEFVNQYKEQGYPEYGIYLALDCAKARDPLDAANAYLEANCPAGDTRCQFFNTKKPFYDIVIELLKGVLSSSQSAPYRKEVLNTAFQYSIRDKVFLFYAYDALLKNDTAKALIKENPPYLEEYFKKSPQDYNHLKLLAGYYQLHKAYANAAKVYKLLASSPVSEDERLEFLSNAEACIASVTAPSQQIEMYRMR